MFQILFQFNRYAFTVLSNLCVYTLTYFILGSGTGNDPSTNEGLSSVAPTTTINPLYPFLNESTTAPNPQECDSSDNSLNPDDLNKFRVSSQRNYQSSF